MWCSTKHRNWTSCCSQQQAKTSIQFACSQQLDPQAGMLPSCLLLRPTQPQTISHMFLDCPVAAAVVSWLCRLWRAMTGCMPEASVATTLAASVSEGQCASDDLAPAQTGCAAQHLDSSLHCCLVRSRFHSPTSLFFIVLSLPKQETVVSMICYDWVKRNDDVRHISGVCSSSAQGQRPEYDIGLFQKYAVSPRRFGIGSHRSG